MQKVVGDKFLLTVGRQMKYAVLRKRQNTKSVYADCTENVC